MTSRGSVVTRLTADHGKKDGGAGQILECPQCHGKFEPKKKNQKFCSQSCRVRHWQFANAGQKVLADIQRELADHEARIRAIEEILKKGD